MAVFLTVEKARAMPFTTKSEVREIRSKRNCTGSIRRLISTRLDDGVFTNRWMVTQEGLQFLEDIIDAYGDN